MVIEINKMVLKINVVISIWLKSNEYKTEIIFVNCLEIYFK